MKLSKALSALPYAHLLGVSAKAEDKDENEMKQGADESDEDYAKRMEEEDEDKKESKAEQEDEDKDNDGMKSKSKAKSEDDDGDGTDEDEDKKDNARAAKVSERARCKAIFACESAGIRPDVAAHLAFETDMSSADAVAMLKTVAVGGKSSGLASRMASVKLPNVGSGAESGAASLTVAQKIIAAGKKRRGEA